MLVVGASIVKLRPGKKRLLAAGVSMRDVLGLLARRRAKGPPREGLSWLRESCDEAYSYNLT
jgi:hypothetical protein